MGFFFLILKGNKTTYSADPYYIDHLNEKLLIFTPLLFLLLMLPYWLYRLDKFKSYKFEFTILFGLKMVRDYKIKVRL